MWKTLPIIFLLLASAAPSLKAEPVVSIPEGMTALTGATVTAPVEIDECSGVMAFDCRIDYDTALLNLSNTDVKTGSLTSDWTLVPNVNDALGWAKVTLFNTSALSGGSGSLLKLNFHVIGSSGTSPLNLSGALNENLIPATFDSGSIIVLPGPPFPGDANLDGRVDETDAAILSANWLAGPGATWGMGNFNADGYVNDVDATLMASNWHVGVAPPAGAAPEPGMSVLSATALLALIYRRFAGKRK